MAQRLVRTLCPHCKKAEPIDPRLWQEFSKGCDLEPTNSAAPVGCLECRQTGFLGRIGLYEMLETTEQLKKQVIPGGDLSALRKQAIDDGLQTLRVSGVKKVAAGLTTIEEVLRVTPNTG